MSFSAKFLAAGEGGLLLIGLVWAWVRDIRFAFHIDPLSLAVALAAAAGLCGLNMGLYRLSLRCGWPKPLHDFLATEVFPLFRRLRTSELLPLVGLVGLGEELLFRGVLQEEIGLLGASLLFGALHGPSRPLWPLAFWAAVMGALLGWVYQATDNLFIPVATHAIYDGAAIAYVRMTHRETTP